MHVTALSNHAACHCFLTVLRVPKVEALLKTDGKFTCTEYTHSKSKKQI